MTGNRHFILFSSEDLVTQHVVSNFALARPDYFLMIQAGHALCSCICNQTIR